MHYVILRDDDTNALTPVECIDRLYRPFLKKGLPVNLAVIPCVRTKLFRADGEPEQFVLHQRGNLPEMMPIAENKELTTYLHENKGLNVVQHGCHHDLYEFGNTDGQEVERRLKFGAECLKEAGFGQPTTFVAPHDKISRAAFSKIAHDCPVISTGWFEWRRAPVSWWPKYVWKKFSKAPHWRAGGSILLSHPGCLLSYMRPYGDMLANIQQTIHQQRLTVLVTHWWEYFRDGKADEEYIKVLHRLADYLGEAQDVHVITFDDLVKSPVPLE